MKNARIVNTGKTVVANYKAREFHKGEAYIPCLIDGQWQKVKAANLEQQSTHTLSAVF